MEIEFIYPREKGASWGLKIGDFLIFADSFEELIFALTNNKIAVTSWVFVNLEDGYAVRDAVHEETHIFEEGDA